MFIITRMTPAMLTTAGGLIVGIPAMFFYFFFKNRLAAITTEIQKQFSYAIDVLSGELQLGGSNQPAASETQQVPTAAAHHGRAGICSIPGR